MFLSDFNIHPHPNIYLLLSFLAVFHLTTTFQSLWHFKAQLSSCLRWTRATIVLEPFLHLPRFTFCASMRAWILPQSTVIQQSFCIWFLCWEAELGWILWDEKARDLRYYSIRYSCIKLRLVWSFWIKNLKQSISWSQIFYLNFNYFNFKVITLNQRKRILHFWKCQNKVFRWLWNAFKMQI